MRQAHRLDQLDAGDRCGAGAVNHQLHVLDVPAGEVQGVDQTCGGDDRRAVLVVMEDRNVHGLAQALLDDEAFRRLDVLEVDAAEGRSEEAHAVDEFVDLLGVDLEVDAIDVGEALEQHRLAFHDRLAGQRTDIAEAEHCGTVGNHGDQVAAHGVVVGGVGVLVDLDAGGGDAGRIGERQVALGDQRLGRDDLDLSRPAGAMHDQRIAVEVSHFVGDHCFRAFARHLRLLPFEAAYWRQSRSGARRRPGARLALQRSFFGASGVWFRPENSTLGANQGRAVGVAPAIPAPGSSACR